MPSGTGYFHITEDTIESLEDDRPFEFKGFSTGSAGKPQGFWISKNLQWTRILNGIAAQDEYSQGVDSAVRMGLGLLPMENETEAPSNAYTILHPAAVLNIYRVKIPRWKKTYSPDKPDRLKILVLNSNTYCRFNTVLWKPFFQEKLSVCLLKIFESVLKFSNLNRHQVYTVLMKFLNDAEAKGTPPAEFKQRLQGLLLSNHVAYAVIEENRVAILDYIKRFFTTHQPDLKSMFLSKEGSFTFDKYPFNSYHIEALLWNVFWTEHFPSLFGGVEFEKSVIESNPGVDPFLKREGVSEDDEELPFWSRTLDVESICLFRPNEMTIEIELLKTIGLDPISQTNTLFNVFGAKANGRVVRVHRAAAGGGRTRAQRRKSKKRRHTRVR